MIRALARRVGYLGYVVRPGFWRWLVDKIDYTVTDQVRPWTELRIPRSCIVHPSASFRNAANISIGEHVRIQPCCVLWASPGSKIQIGDGSGLGPHTMVYSSNHQFAADKPYHQQPWTEADVIIGKDCWIGGGSVILPGVTIGDQCVVAAGSVVTRSVAPGSIVAGVPAKVIKMRTSADTLPGPSETLPA